MKNTNHTYKGYQILGRTRITQGGWVLGGRHYVEGGVKRNYQIKKDGKFVVNPNDIFEQLKHAKEYIDEVISKR
jgi:hypothetical protein